MATLVPPTQEKSHQRENKAPSVDINLAVSSNESSQQNTQNELMAKYEQWKARTLAVSTENTAQPSKPLEDIKQSALSKYEKWKVEKAIAEQQAQLEVEKLEAEKQRQLEQSQQHTPKHDNDRGFSL